MKKFKFYRATNPNRIVVSLSSRLHIMAQQESEGISICAIRNLNRSGKTLLSDVYYNEKSLAKSIKKFVLQNKIQLAKLLK